MMLRVALASLLVAVAPVASVAAQNAAAPGSLTLFSRPAEVSFRITGDQEVSGRTPVTLSPWLPGRYRITGSERGYDRWSREVVFDGAASDTLWLTLRRKNALQAGGRALVLPGWGQLYNQHPKRGMVFLITTAAAATGAGLAHMRYRDRVDDADAAHAAYLASPTPATGAAWQDAVDRRGEAERVRAGFIWSTVGVWGLGVIDAIAFVPRPLPPNVAGGASGALQGFPADMRVGVTFARVRF